MKFIFFQLIFVIYEFELFFSKNIVEIESLKMFLKNCTSFDDVDSLIISGGMGGYWTTEEYIYFVRLLKKDYSDILKIEESSKTLNNNPIYGISFQLNETNKSGILFTGVHHAREPISLLMNIYIILKLLFEVTNNSIEYIELINTRNIHFIPLVNIDAYQYNNALFQSTTTHDFGFARKNRRNGPIFSNCDEVDIGIDLNRNYGYKFNFSELSSSSDPCSQIYRGEYAFSELETQAVKYFIENHTDINIAYNYHTYGNIYITPYSFDIDPENKILKETSTYFFNLYQEFEKQKIFPKYNQFGNTIETLQYICDGEASDWMLSEKKILAFSPELGDEDISSETFYPSLQTALNVVKENLSAAIFGIQKSGYSFKLNAIRNFNNQNNFYLSSFMNLQSNSLFELVSPNYNDDSLYYYAKCSEASLNPSFNLLKENEYDLIYSNSQFEKYCQKDELLFYSISATINNEGLSYFSYKGVISINIKTQGMSNVMGDLVKFDYSNSTLIRMQDPLDSKTNLDYSINKFKITQQSNFIIYEYNYTINNIEPNGTLLLDLKLFSDGTTSLENTYIDLSISIIYFINDQIIRKFQVTKLNKNDFKYFNSESNLFASGVFNEESYEIMEILSPYSEIIKSKKVRNLWYVYYLILPIIGVICLSSIFVLLIFKKNILKSKNGNAQQNNKKNKFEIIEKAGNREKQLENIAIIYSNSSRDIKNNLEILTIKPLRKNLAIDKNNITDRIEIMSINASKII